MLPRLSLVGLVFALLLAVPGRRALAGPGEVSVPDVTGNPAEAARLTLEGQGLNVEIVGVAGPPVGRVERQDPPATTRVPTGTEVRLRVGIALRIETRLPDLRGRTL